MVAEQLVRAANEEGCISEGSLFKLRCTETGNYLELEQRHIRSMMTKRASRILEPTAAEKEMRAILKADYGKSFKAVVASPDQQLPILILTELAKYIRRFDLETSKRYTDYTEEALLHVLSKALRKLKLLCINALPGTIHPLHPYKLPNENTQRVFLTSTRSSSEKCDASIPWPRCFSSCFLEAPVSTTHRTR
jgi:hypothetical protein